MQLMLGPFFSEGLNFASNDSLLCGNDLCSDVILTIV